MYVMVYGILLVVDDCFGNNENIVVLEGYEKIDVGLMLELIELFCFQFFVDNLIDE